MKISILSPVKNEERYIEECILSVHNQTLISWELILINDHSSDNSETIISQYAVKDPRIRLLQNKGKGIIDALKTGYDTASGDLITRMDADDLMHPQKIEVMQQQLIEYGRGHVATSLVEYFSLEGVKEGFKKYENWLNALTRKGDNFKDIYKECVIPSPSWMLFKEDLDRIGAFDDLVYPEDYHLAFKMYEAGLKVIPSDRVLHYWRDHQDRASRNDPNYADNTFIPLKISFFIRFELNNEKQLVLWGAGKKGKRIAQHLTDRDLNFKWITNNKNKIGHTVYGETLVAFKPFSTPTQVIIAVANKKQQKEIKDILEKTQSEVFYFC